MLDKNMLFRSYGLAEMAVAQGIAFRAFDEVNIPANTDQMYSMLLPADKACVLLDRIISSDQPNLRYEVFTAATGVAYGAAVTIRNMNSTSAKTSGATLRRLTTGAPSGTMSDLDIARGGGGGNNATGGTARGDDIRIFPPALEIFVRVRNISNSVANVLVYLKFMVAPSGMFNDAQ